MKGEAVSWPEEKKGVGRRGQGRKAEKDERKTKRERRKRRGSERKWRRR